MLNIDTAMTNQMLYNINNNVCGLQCNQDIEDKNYNEMMTKLMSYQYGWHYKIMQLRMNDKSNTRNLLTIKII